MGLKDLKEVKEKQDHGEHKEQETSANVVIKRNKELLLLLVLGQVLRLTFLRQRLVILFLLPFQVHLAFANCVALKTMSSSLFHWG